MTKEELSLRGSEELRDFFKENYDHYKCVEKVSRIATRYYSFMISPVYVREQLKIIGYMFPKTAGKPRVKASIYDYELGLD